MLASQNKTCQNCKQGFTIESSDFSFYEKIQVPPPTFCPECRLVRRLAWRNERALYKRKCDLCGKEKILQLHPESPMKAYCRECWWSDNWDPTVCAKDYDFSRTFFDQFNDLIRAVPRIGNIKQGNIIESDYTNRVSDLKNCYLIFGSNVNENCTYGSWFNDSKDSMDGYNVQKSERCYECIDCFGCYNLFFSQDCANSHDSYFLTNCRNCSNCFGCVNLRGKNYCIFNKQYSKEEYEKVIQQYLTGSSIILDGIKLKVAALKARQIMPSIVEHHSTDISGNWIEDSKNARTAFNCRNTEDVKYVFALLEAKDSMDHCHWGRGTELIYDAINVGRQCSRIFFSSECWDQNMDLRYCINCHGSRNLFGCIGLRNKQYFIFNKQYGKEEYENLILKIVDHMNTMPYADAKNRLYRYGEFFPMELSPFAYNETIAQEFFPISKEAAIERGYAWKEPELRNYQITVSADQLPDRIIDVPDSIINDLIRCEHNQQCSEQCTQAFRIIPAELKFYRTANLPLPKLCPNCRHYYRIRGRNPMKLWHRHCACSGTRGTNLSNANIYSNTATHFHGNNHCPNEFETSYAPDRPETVYCLQCYNAEIA